MQDFTGWYVTFRKDNTARRAAMVLNNTARTLAQQSVNVAVHFAPPFPTARRASLWDQQKKPGKWDDKDMVEAAKKIVLNDLKKALEKIVAGQDLPSNGEFVFEDDEGGMVAFIEVPEDIDGDLAGASLEDILRAVGYDVKAKSEASADDDANDEREERKGQRRDEL